MADLKSVTQGYFSPILVLLLTEKPPGYFGFLAGAAPRGRYPAAALVRARDEGCYLARNMLSLGTGFFFHFHTVGDRQVGVFFSLFSQIQAAKILK